MHTTHYRILLIVALLVGLSTPVFAASGYLSPASMDLAEGTSGSVSLVFDVGASALGNYRVKLTWDDSVLTVDSVTAGTAAEFGAPNQVNLTTPGEAIFLDVNIGSLLTPTGIVNVASINMTALSIGSTAMALEIIDLADTDGTAITATASNTTINVTNGEWIFGGTMTNRREHPASVVLDNGKVLTTGGATSGSGGHNTTCELYDPDTNTWTSTSSMLNTGRQGHGLVLLDNGKALLIGGYTGSGAGDIADCELYDPVTNTWSLTDPLNQGRTNVCCVKIADGSVLVSGGGSSYFSTAEVYDPTTNLWTQVNDMNSRRLRHTLTLLDNNMVLAVGGYNGTTVVNTCELFNPATGTWSLTGSITDERYYHAAVKLPDGKVLIAGGMDDTNQGLASCEIYDPDTGLWTPTDSMSVTRKYPQAVYLPNSRVLIAGDYNPSNYVAELYNPTTGLWSLTDDNLVPRGMFNMVVLKSGFALAIGGRNSSSNDALNTAEYFIPVSSGPSLWLEPENATVYRNQEVELTVKMSDTTDVVGYRVALNFDANQLAYIPGSATSGFTSTATGWYEITVNDATPSQVIFASAGKIPLPAGEGSLLKFRFLVNSGLPDFENIAVTFDPLTSINEDAIAASTQIWNATVLGSNHAPSFTGGANQTVLEDVGAQTVAGWATNIVEGPAYESWQEVWFEVSNNNPSLFTAQPTISPTGTLNFTPAFNANGVASATAFLHDNGGTANGGIDTSTAYYFSISVTPVNDAPTLDPISNPAPINEDAGVQVISLTGIGDGDPEISQMLVVRAISSNTNVIPIPNVTYTSPQSTGTIDYTPVPGASGVSIITIEVEDNGSNVPPNVNLTSRTFTVVVNAVNDEPTLDPIVSPITIDEDAPLQTIPLTGITDGDPEFVQNLVVRATSSNSDLTSVPAVVYTPNNTFGAIQFTPVANQFGSAIFTIEVEDNGSNTYPNDNILSSTCLIVVRPVNDAPSFIKGATMMVLNEFGAPEMRLNWATNISAGPINESSQTLHFEVSASHPELFSATPAVDPSGTLTLTPAAGAHGVSIASVTLWDDGGTLYGGDNNSDPQTFTIKIYVPFLWGDLNDNNIAGAVDASLLLQFDAGLINVFPGYPLAEYPEYYPDPVHPWNSFPWAADVSGDGIAGTVDASHILQFYALIRVFFDVDLNEDFWGPDGPLPAGKRFLRTATIERKLLIDVEPGENGSWRLIFSVDEAEGLSGIRLTLTYDPAQLSVDTAKANWLVPGGMLVANDTQPGRLILAGALTNPLTAGPGDLLEVTFTALTGADLSTTIVVNVDRGLTQLNDGALPLASDSRMSIDLLDPTAVDYWMLH